MSRDTRHVPGFNLKKGISRPPESHSKLLTLAVRIHKRFVAAGLRYSRFAPSTSEDARTRSLFRQPPDRTYPRYVPSDAVSSEHELEKPLWNNNLDDELDFNGTEGLSCQ